jgi:anhydro-N-acetylmuramic acid kinase
MTDCFVGLMSGTSLDGIDAVVVDFSEKKPKVLSEASFPMPPRLRVALLDLNDPDGKNELDRAARAGVELAQHYARMAREAIARSGLGPGRITAIGCHGQTVRHHPELGYTIQLGNGALLAELSGITVVTDFRSRDIAAGGQGAPLVPAFHDAVFRSETIPRMILNLGGFSNLTLLLPGRETGGYDCGPANVLLDGWIERHRGLSFDADGAWARTGTVSQPLLQALLSHPHFKRSAPKSTGRDEFHLRWLDALPQVAGLKPEDVQATLAELSAQAAAVCIAAEQVAGLEVYCCGGGAFNNVVVERIQALLPGVTVLTTDALGIPVHLVEASAFAWLAKALLDHQPGNLPAVTGAHGPVLLGAIYPA